MNIILGGTHGLGAEIAAQLQSAGEETFVTGRTYDAAKHGPGAAVDLAESEDVRVLLKQLDEKITPAEAVNFYWCAAMGYAGDFAAQPDVQRMAAVNLGGVLGVAQYAWKQMLARDAVSRFVVVSSTTGAKARPNEAVYAATKHAQVGFARSLGLESERLGSNIRVALFMPGGMQTPFWDTIGQPSSYSEFLDPKKVAQRMLERVAAQTDPYYEETIERGSL